MRIAITFQMIGCNMTWSLIILEYSSKTKHIEEISPEYILCQIMLINHHFMRWLVGDYITLDLSKILPKTCYGDGDKKQKEVLHHPKHVLIETYLCTKNGYFLRKKSSWCRNSLLEMKLSTRLPESFNKKGMIEFHVYNHQSLQGLESKSILSLEGVLVCRYHHSQVQSQSLIVGKITHCSMRLQLDSAKQWVGPNGVILLLWENNGLW